MQFQERCTSMKQWLGMNHILTFHQDVSMWIPLLQYTHHILNLSGRHLIFLLLKKQIKIGWKSKLKKMQHKFLPGSQPSSSPGWMLRIVCRLTTEDPPLGPLAANSLSAGQLMRGEIKSINKQVWIYLVCLVSNPLHLSWTMFHTFDQLSRYLDVTFKTNTWVGHCQL